jgi:hypothetical protein
MSAEPHLRPYAVRRSVIRPFLPDVTGGVVGFAVDGDTARVGARLARYAAAPPLATPIGELLASGRHVEFRATLRQRYEGELLAHERNYLA